MISISSAALEASITRGNGQSKNGFSPAPLGPCIPSWCHPSHHVCRMALVIPLVGPLPMPLLPAEIFARNPIHNGCRARLFTIFSGISQHPDPHSTVPGGELCCPAGAAGAIWIPSGREQRIKHCHFFPTSFMILKTAA